MQQQEPAPVLIDTRYVEQEHREALAGYYKGKPVF